jgi:HD-GYP domain-containing protein (c-di-GMP phosphodiesterase class II)
VYGALSEDRPYRPGLRIDETLGIMANLAPYQLDGDCLDALICTVSGNHNLVSVPPAHLAGSPLAYAFESAI